jgi:KaiC/GvpD/RAD55 family RecA-like ATPase
MDLPFNEENEGMIYLVLSEPQDSGKKNIEIIKEITDKGFTAIVISTNDPYNVLRKDYRKGGINLDHVYFIDAITKYAIGKESKGAENCTFVNNPSNLTDMGIAVTELLKHIEGENVWVILDSVNSMLIYVSSVNLTKFIHFITSKLRILDMSGVLLAVENGIDPSTLSQLEGFVDGIIKSEG